MEDKGSHSSCILQDVSIAYAVKLYMVVQKELGLDGLNLEDITLILSHWFMFWYD